MCKHKIQKKRYLSKNNQNIKRIDFILKTFPKAKIFIPFRSPLQQAYSLLTQHKRFVAKSQKNSFIADYMYWIGHTEFGPKYEPVYNKSYKYKDYFDINHCLEQWYLTYETCLQEHCKNKNVTFICYEKLCKSENYWNDILKYSDIKKLYF